MYRTDGSLRRVTNRASRCRHALAWHCDCPQATMVFPRHECRRILCRTPGRNRSTATCQYPIRPAGCSTTFVRSCCSSIRSLRLRATLVLWSSYMCIPPAAGTTTSVSSWPPNPARASREGETPVRHGYGEIQEQSLRQESLLPPACARVVHQRAAK